MTTFGACRNEKAWPLLLGLSGDQIPLGAFTLETGELVTYYRTRRRHTNETNTDKKTIDLLNLHA